MCGAMLCVVLRRMQQFSTIRKGQNCNCRIPHCRHLHADRAGKILINLCVAIAFLNLCFVIGGLLPQDVPCSVMSTLIHFFSLAAFLW